MLKRRRNLELKIEDKIYAKANYYGHLMLQMNKQMQIFFGNV